MNFGKMIKELIPHINKTGSNGMDSEIVCEYQNAYNIQVLKYDKLLQESLNRAAVTNRLLKTKLLKMEIREKLEQEMQDIQYILAINKQQLDHLRKKDGGLFNRAIFLIIICCLIYASYYIFTYDVSAAFPYHVYDTHLQ